MVLPKDLKSVKKRIRAWHVFERIVRTAFITLIVSCVLIFVGFAGLFIAAVSALPSHWGDGGLPLSPATPCLKNARFDCINDIRAIMSRRRISVRRGAEVIDNITCSDFRVTILEEYDFSPYFVFHGRIELPQQKLSESIVLTAQQTDFFLVNRFNPLQAEHLRGRENMYFSEHYDLIHVKFGYE